MPGKNPGHWGISADGRVNTGLPMSHWEHLLSPTCTVALAWEPARAQHLFFILLIYYTALAQVWGQFGWVQGAGQLVPHTLNLLPQSLFLLFFP